MNILVGYASAHGSTAEVAEFIGRVLKVYDVAVKVADVQTVGRIDAYDVVMLGSAIHGGMWLQSMSQFITRFAAKLAHKPLYVWITCIRALEPDGMHHAREVYVDHQTLRAFDVRDVEVFTGKLNPYTIDRTEQWYLVARYDGKVAPGLIKDDFRDWQAIAAWTNGVAKQLHLQPVFGVLDEA